MLGRGALLGSTRKYLGKVYPRHVDPKIEWRYSERGEALAHTIKQRINCIQKSQHNQLTSNKSQPQ